MDQLEYDATTKNEMVNNEGIPLQSAMLSLCMIARDNEKTISDALESVKPYVDELIVVDTGSVDETPSIARSLGARVETFPWVDDFAAARNKSLDLATGRWVIWMDTDDTLPSQCGKQLRRLLSNDALDEKVMGFIMQVHCPSSSEDNSLNQDLKQPTQQSATIVDHVKVVRNHPSIRFEGRIHEQILPSIRRLGGRVEWTDLYVVHSGSDDSMQGRQRKLKRDMRILRKDLSDRPNHPFVLFNLGMTLVFSQEYEQACDVLQRCIANSMTAESHLRKAYAFLADSIERVESISRAKQTCWEGLGRYPEDQELAFKLGRLLMLEKNWDEAILAFERARRSPGTRYFSSMDPGISGHKALANLAICHEAAEQIHEAVDCWMQCIGRSPGAVDAWEAILTICHDNSVKQPLKTLIDEYGDDDELAGYVAACRALLAGSSDLPTAINHFEAAIDHSSVTSILDHFARFLVENQQWSLANRTLRKLIRKEPAVAAHHFNLGHSLYQLEDYSAARVALQASLQLRPNHAQTHRLIHACDTQHVRLVDSKPVVGEDDRTDACTDSKLILTTCFIRQPDPQRELAWAEIPDLRFTIRHWVERVKQLGIEAIILYDGLSPEVVEELKGQSVAFEQMEQRDSYSGREFRFLALHDFLANQSKSNLVCCTDLFDVTVIGDPFEMIPKEVGLFVGREPIRIRENNWFQTHWKSIWGESAPSVLLEEYVLNAGIFGGQRERVVECLALMANHIKSKSTDSGFASPAILNSVIYRELEDKTVWTEGEPLHSEFGSFEYERDDVAIIHK